MNDHLTTECESKEKFTNCPTCSKAVLSASLQQHENTNDCIKSDKPVCYLCRLEIENDTDEVAIVLILLKFVVSFINHYTE